MESNGSVSRVAAMVVVAMFAALGRAGEVGIPEKISPADPNLIPEARAVLDYLRSVHGKKVVAAVNGGGDVRLAELKTIHVSAQADAGEQSIANRLLDAIAKLHQAKAELKKEVPPPGSMGVFVGREAALASGMISVEELDAVKHDGYVLKARDGRIAVAGSKPQGTIYGACALMRRMGLEMYPWHGARGGVSGDHALEVFTPVKDGVLAALSVSEKPFIDHRDAFGNQDLGRWGGTFRPYALSDPTTAANQDLFGRDRKPGYTKLKLVGKAAEVDWVGWDHVAGYLVPRDLYYEAHPEYFAMETDGKRIGPRAFGGMGICTSHPDVRRISAERMLEWMGLQSVRRFFMATEADGVFCRCPVCRALDPQPDYISDRSVAWANHIADHIRQKHPDKLLANWAYSATVKPPVRVKPAPNLVIGYAAWLWNSRFSSAVDFAHPVNITCMEEFMGWSLVARGQMGAYDYPGDSIGGMARRLKFYARNGVRFVYANGPSGGARQHYLMNSLMWDPFLDAEALDRKFLKASYGPATEQIMEYARQEEEVIASRSIDGLRKYGCEDPAFAAKARPLLDRIEKTAGSTEAGTRARIMQFLIDARYALLRSTHPTRGLSALGRVDPAQFERDLKGFLATHQRFAAEAAGLGMSFDASKDLRLKLDPLGIKSATSSPASGPASERAEPKKQEKLFDETIAEAADVVQRELRSTFVLEPVASSALRFDAADEPKRWLVGSTRPDLAAPAEAARITMPDNTELHGVRLKAPLSGLPELPRGNIKVHVGEFHAERSIEPAFDMGHLPYLTCHLHASRDVPATICANLGADRLKMDVLLHAGEQIVRMDLRNFAVDFAKWDGKLRGIAVQVWPQDNNWPYPRARDAEVTVLGLEATNRAAQPASLPRRPAAIWMTHFRANLPHDVSRTLADTREAYAALMREHPDTHKAFTYQSGRGENFRTWTPHRTVSPVFAILTDDTAGAKDAADIMQRYLEKLHGVKLPINPAGWSVGPDAGNAIILGRKAALSAGRVTEAELGHVGLEGFVIRARDGRIVIAGADDAGTRHGVVRYLEDLAARFPVPGACETVPDRRGRFLHELVLFDWPFFKQRPVPGGVFLMAQGAVKTWPQAGPADEAAVAAAQRLAEAIKDCGRGGKSELPENALKAAQDSPLAAYVAAKLLWDPFADTTRLVREFECATQTAGAAR